MKFHHNTQLQGTATIVILTILMQSWIMKLRVRTCVSGSKGKVNFHHCPQQRIGTAILAAQIKLGMLSSLILPKKLLMMPRDPLIIIAGKDQLLKLAYLILSHG